MFQNGYATSYYVIVNARFEGRWLTVRNSFRYYVCKYIIINQIYLLFRLSNVVELRGAGLGRMIVINSELNGAT